MRQGIEQNKQENDDDVFAQHTHPYVIRVKPYSPYSPSGPRSQQQKSIVRVKHEQACHGIDLFGAGIIVNRGNPVGLAGANFVALRIRIHFHRPVGIAFTAALPNPLLPGHVVQLDRDSMRMNMRAEEMNPGVEWQLESRLPFIMSWRDKKQVWRLDAA